MRSTFNKAACFVVRLKRTTKETQVATRKTNIIAEVTLCRVSANVTPKRSNVNKAPWKLELLNNAGKTMKKENIGMKSKVRFKKKPAPIPETQASNKQNKYKLKTLAILFANNARKMNKINVSVFIRGSNDCKSRLPAAYSWLNKEFLSIPAALIKDRWIKPRLAI